MQENYRKRWEVWGKYRRNIGTYRNIWKIWKTYGNKNRKIIAKYGKDIEKLQENMGSCMKMGICNQPKFG